MPTLQATTSLFMLRHLDGALIRAAALPDSGETVKVLGQNGIEWRITQARDALLRCIVADVKADTIAASIPANPAEQPDPMAAE